MDLGRQANNNFSSHVCHTGVVRDKCNRCVKESCIKYLDGSVLFLTLQ